MKLFGNRKGKSKKISNHKTPPSGNKKRLTGLQRGLIILAAFVVGLVVFCVVLWNTFAQPPDVVAGPVTSQISGSGVLEYSPKVTTTTTTTIDPLTSEEIEVEIEIDMEVGQGRKSDFYTVLLIGVDNDGMLTDTIMVAAFDVGQGKLNIVSVPRDTLINVSWYPYKVNSAYGVGGTGEKGMEYLKNEISKLIGFQIDCYALIELKAFVQIVDLIGGVTFDVPQAMHYSDPTQNLYINLSAGEQLLDGQKAMQLVRFRSYPTGDLQRVQVQQDFMIALAKQCLKAKNLIKIGDFAKILSENLLTDLSIQNIAYFGQELLKLSADDISVYTLPGEARYWRELSYYMLNASEVVDLVNEVLNPYTTDIKLSDLNVVKVSGGAMVSQTGTSIVSRSAASSYSSSSVKTTAAPTVVGTTAPEETSTPVETGDIIVPTDEPLETAESPQVSPAGTTGTPASAVPTTTAPEATATPTEAAPSPSVQAEEPVSSAGSVGDENVVVPTDPPIS